MRRPPTDRPGFGHIASVLRHRNYRLLWSGLMVSNSGDWMDQVALNWLVLQTTGSAFYLGLVNLFRAVPILALTLLGGVAADRFERRRLMMVSQSVGMVLAIILALLVYQGQAHIWVILAIAAGRGAVVAFNQPARQTLISEIVPQSILPSAIALNALTMNLTKVIGPLLAGLIIANLGMAACFAVNAASFLAVLYTLHSMEFPPRAARPEPEPVLVSLMSGFRYLWDNQTVLILVLVAIIPTFFGQPYLYLLALFAVEIYHVGAEGVGLMTASAAMGAICGATLLATIPSAGRRGNFMLSAMLMQGLLIFLFAMTDSFLLGSCLLAGIGASQVMCNASNNILLQTSVPDHVRGRVLSVLYLNKGMVQLGTAVVASLAALTGVRVALALSSGVVVISAIAVLVLVPSIRRLRT